MRTAEEILFEAQLILGHWLVPKDMTDRECLDRLVELLDGPDAVGIAIAAGRIPAESAEHAKVVEFLVRKSRERLVAPKPDVYNP